MIFKMNHFLFVMILSFVFMVQSSTSSPLEIDKLAELTERLERMQNKMEDEKMELTERFDRMQNKMEALQAQNEKLATRVGNLEIEKAELQLQNSQQDEEIVHLKSQISSLESLLPSKLASNGATNPSLYKNDGSSTRVLSSPPTSCQELKDNNGLIPMDGLHLLKNNGKIQVAFCTFPTGSNPASQQVVGTVDVKTKTVHFYVQRNSSFGTGGAYIPFELARLNEGNAFDLASGTFTVPVPGIYNFQFSAVKSSSATKLNIEFRVNDVNVGETWTVQAATGSNDVVSLSASLRLKAGDTVKLYNYGSGVLADSSYHYTHFSGWLVEEELI